MKNLYLISSLGLIFLSTLSAQEAVTPAPPEEPKINKITDPAKHIAKQNATVLKSAQASNPALIAMRKKIAAIQNLREDYLKKITNGSINPLQHWESIAPQLTQQLPLLQKHYSDYLSTTDPLKKQQIQSLLLTTLQPFGDYLQNAQHKKTDLRLTKQQVQQLKSLKTKKQKIALSEDTKHRGLSFTPTDYLFTLLELPIPITLKSTPNTTIYLESDTGGRFPNGLALTTVKTNAQGIATTSWVSHGDSVAANTIHAISDSGEAVLNVEVKALKINFPTINATTTDLFNTLKDAKKIKPLNKPQIKPDTLKPDAPKQ